VDVERRPGSGRGKSSVGRGTPRALRHEIRPGRLSEEQTVERVRNPEDGTYRERQTRARHGNASQWTRRLDSAVGAETSGEAPRMHARCAAAGDGHTL